MKTKISNKLLFVLLLSSLMPLLIAGAVGYSNSRNITKIAAEANRQVAELAMSDSTAALSKEQEIHLKSSVTSVAGDINEILSRIQADTGQLADFAMFLYNHPETIGRYPQPSVYAADPDKKMFGSIQENQNSWLGVFRQGTNERGQVSSAVMDEIHLTEFLDIMFRSVAQHNPYAVQLYLNTESQITRGMPFINGKYVWVNAVEQFDVDDDVTAFDFYYLADEVHNPGRKTTWTELYWDPAGLGWMVSSIAPVYRENELMGVVGIDITLGKMIDEVIDVQVAQTGFAFLMSGSGQAIAFPERATEFLGFNGSLEGDFGNNEQFSFFLTETNDATFRSIIERMRAGEYDLTIYTLPANGQEYFFAYHPVNLTGWSVGMVVPVEEVIAPALQTNEQIEQNMETMSQNIAERSQSLMTTFALILGAIVIAIVPLATLFARTISNPIRTLEDGSKRIGAGDLAHRISLNSGDEIEELAKTFNQMAADLQTKVEEIEAANTELRKLDELKSQFISIASHELRTPLIAIQGYVDLLRDKAVHQRDKDPKKMLDTISRNATRLTRIVTELLDLSRIEENKLVLVRDTMSIAEVIREVVDEQKPSLDKRGHTLTLAIQPNLPNVFGDRDRVAQVIINLLGNAIKYTPDGGHIQIQAALNGEFVQVGISDNGIGIKEEDIGRLFKRFSTVHDVTKHRTGKDEFMAGGTGLGLSIVAGVVKAHNGQIWVESEYGRGSTFYVTFPLAGQHPPGPSFDPGEAEPSDLFKVKRFEQQVKPIVCANGKLKVLVIDDEEDVLAVTRYVLENDYEVLTAQTSATGLKAALNYTPNLILLDIWMPGISGFEVCKTLKRNSKTKDIPVIIFTAATEKVNEQEAFEGGADGFVSKPFKKDELIHLIESFRMKAGDNVQPAAT
ncbi:MAG: ATP-binding protein [Chloroflexota bacterium]